MLNGKGGPCICIIIALGEGFPSNIHWLGAHRRSSGRMDEAVAMAEAQAMVADEAPARTTRLIIKNLELENFKSYAGKVMVGPFNKSMTSIIGPNGSGKSNVIDALLFVFGFNASKMRMENLTHLIHKDENRKEPLQYAKVGGEGWLPPLTGLRHGSRLYLLAALQPRPGVRAALRCAPKLATPCAVGLRLLPTHYGR